MKKRVRTLTDGVVVILAIGYIAYSLSRLADFPFIHSDEIWLLKLSQQMANSGSLFVTEPFFDLFPRLAHAIKILYHAIQIGWAQLFGYSVLSMRGLTLLIALLALGLFYALVWQRTKSKWLALSYSSVIALNIQFIYMSHFARQEALILLALVALFYALERWQYSLKMAWICALINGLSIAIHPNSFLLATTFGAVLLTTAIARRQFKPLAFYALGCAAWAALFVALSLWQSGDFFSRYAGLGAAQGTAASPLQKLLTLPIFFYKLYRGISGTYYVPDIRSGLLLAALLILACTLFYRSAQRELAAFLGLTIGLVIIGRYNATAIVFYLPLIGLALLRLLSSLPDRQQLAMLLAIALIFSYGSFKALKKAPLESFATFNDAIAAHIDPERAALANLNQATHLIKFYDYRNLAHLSDHRQTIEDYLTKNQIDMIIWSEEMDYVYRNIDDWYILYGEMPYYEALKAIIARDFTAVGSFESPLYGMRIVKYQDGYPWRITIYQRNECEPSTIVK